MRPRRLQWGARGLEFIERIHGYEAFVIGSDLRAGRTSGLESVWDEVA
jgi:hypothetical protein